MKNILKAHSLKLGTINCVIQLKQISTFAHNSPSASITFPLKPFVIICLKLFLNIAEESGDIFAPRENITSSGWDDLIVIEELAPNGINMPLVCFFELMEMMKRWKRFFQVINYSKNIHLRKLIKILLNES